VEENVDHLTKNIEKFFDRAFRYAHLRVGLAQKGNIAPVALNNLTWHREFSMLDFLRRVGTQARVNTMLNRER
jgi:tyrosyl-tRNA synthetase